MPSHLDDAMERLSPMVPLMPFTQRLALRNTWLFGPLIEKEFRKAPAMNASIRTTTALTVVEGGVKENVLPISARATINFRVLPGDDEDSILSHLAHHVDEEAVDIQVGFYNPASNVSDTSHSSFQTLAASIADIYGRDDLTIAPYLVLGGTDTKHFQELSDQIYRFYFAQLGPGDPARIHGTNERIAVEDYRNMIRFYAVLMQRTVF